MFAQVFTTFALVAAVSNAITVESPTKDTVWASGSNSQTVSWEAVSTDATSFAIQLINQASARASLRVRDRLADDIQAGFLDNSPVTLVANQSTGSSGQVNSVTVTYPNGNWPVGTAFQINLVAEASGSSAIYAQSGQFNITSSGSSSSGGSSSASSSGSAPSTITVSSSTSTIPAVTAGRNGATTSASASGGGIPGAVTSTGSADAVFGKPSAFIGLLMGAAALMGVTF